jgi:hypothetical protein
MANKPANQLIALVPRQPPQKQCGHMRQTDPRRLKLGAEGSDEEHRQPPDLFHRNIEQLAGTRIGPMPSAGAFCWATARSK